MNFPVFKNHSEAQCFRCGGNLSSPEKSGYPKGSGEYVGVCVQCEDRNVTPKTWYDTQEENNDDR